MNKVSQKLFKRMEVSFLLVGLVIIALVIVFFVFFPWSPNTTDTADTTDAAGQTGDRISALEEKLARMEATLAMMGEQTNRFEKHADRFERTAATLSLKINRLSDDVDRLKRTSSARATAPKTALKPEAGAKKTGARYHEVKRKETLYSISRQYGLTVGELRRLNNLSLKDVLHVGQRLKVGR